MVVYNQAMRRKINKGDCIDLAQHKREGKFYVLPVFIDDVDYCNGRTEEWIWSIGRRLSDGVILASHGTDLYQNPDFECLWLR